jgi:hypothetical protein
MSSRVTHLFRFVCIQYVLKYILFQYYIIIYNLIARESDKQCSIVYNNGPLLVFDSSFGLGQAGIPSDRLSLKSHWTQYYLKNKRDPSNTRDLPPWVLGYLGKYSGLVSSIFERL